MKNDMRNGKNITFGNYNRIFHGIMSDMSSKLWKNETKFYYYYYSIRKPLKGVRVRMFSKFSNNYVYFLFYFNISKL